MTGKKEADKLEQFSRIRAIHDEMVRLAEASDWLVLEQDLRPNPLSLVSNHLWKSSDIEYYPPPPSSTTTMSQKDGVAVNGQSNQKAPTKDPLDGAV